MGLFNNEEETEPNISTIDFTTVMTSTSSLTSKTEESSSDAIWCPTHRIGNECPEETFISFYKCCGHLNKECCFHLRVWVVIMIIVLPMCLVLPALTILVRRIFCAPMMRHPRSTPREGVVSAADRVRQLASEDSAATRRDSEDEMVVL